jgi:hypothetical protein
VETRKLGVEGRDQQAKKVVAQIAFRALVAKQQKFSGFDRVSVSSLANLNDLWPELRLLCAVEIGRQECYAIWHNRRKLDATMQEGEQYRFVPRLTPGFAPPMTTRSQGRTSISGD